MCTPLVHCKGVMTNFASLVPLGITLHFNIAITLLGCPSSVCDCIFGFISFLYMLDIDINLFFSYKVFQRYTMFKTRSLMAGVVPSIGLGALSEPLNVVSKQDGQWS